jgi:hypothetical protein
MERIDKQLREAEVDVKTLIDWDDAQKVEQLTLYLREMQGELEAKMTQSIESHILSKQKAVSTLNQALPTLLCHPLAEVATAPELEALVEMLEVKSKIDFCLERLEPVVHLASDDA